MGPPRPLRIAVARDQPRLAKSWPNVCDLDELLTVNSTIALGLSDERLRPVSPLLRELRESGIMSSLQQDLPQFDMLVAENRPLRRAVYTARRTPTRY